MIEQTEDKIAAAEERALQYARDKFWHHFQRLRDRCGSPIEEILLAEMIVDLVIDRYESAFFYAGDFEWPGSEPMVNGIHVYLQARVGGYRADFLIREFRNDAERWLVVECDGHDFHDRTKEQAAHDRQRDRWMAAQGIGVARFTGSEIWRDPSKCMADVAAVLDQQPFTRR